MNLIEVRKAHKKFDTLVNEIIKRYDLDQKEAIEKAKDFIKQYNVNKDIIDLLREVGSP